MRGSTAIDGDRLEPVFELDEYPLIRDLFRAGPAGHRVVVGDGGAAAGSVEAVQVKAGETVQEQVSKATETVTAQTVNGTEQAAAVATETAEAWPICRLCSPK